jgi:hypothetical protein
MTGKPMSPGVRLNVAHVIRAEKQGLPLASELLLRPA